MVTVFFKLFNSLLNISDYMVSNDRMRGESRFRNDIEIEVHDIDLHHYRHHLRFVILVHDALLFGEYLLVYTASRPTILQTSSLLVS